MRGNPKHDPDSVARHVQRGVSTAIEASTVIDVAAQSLLRAVPADLWCGVLLDPATLLDTGGVHQHGFPAGVMPRLFEIEHGEQDDVDSLRRLVRRPQPVSLLSRSTEGRLHESKYFRDILQPLGLADEMRVLLRDGRRTWGMLVMCREAGSPPFTEADLQVGQAIASPAASALRRTMLTAERDHGDTPDAPGVAVLLDDHTLTSASPTAQRWFDQLHSGLEGVPTPVRAIVGHTRTLRPGASTRSRARTRSGTWVSLHAWRTAEHTTVSIGPTLPGDLIALILDAYGLTPRERELTQHLLLGRSTSEIARRMRLSEHTVQDYLKGIFDKTGVRSRRDLVAEIFARHYLPQLTDPSLTTDGRLRPQPQ